jgi:hypothetical protein
MVAPLAALAQQPTIGSIEMRVFDDQGRGLPGATVTITGPMGERSMVSSPNGTAAFKSVGVGTYRVRVTMTGFATIEVPDVGVSAGQRAKLPVTLASGTVETVTVISSAPLVDPRQMEVSSTFKTSEAAESLPIGRNFTAAVAFAPGVVSGLGTGEGNYSIGGSSGLENSYTIDGVNITDGGYGGVGTYSIVFGSLGTGITSDFLEEVQVKTAGFEAEYGQALGGVVTGVVKSGTNDLSGSVKVFASPDSLESSGDDVSLPTGAINTHDRGETDLGISAGGPIAKDRAFWFAAFNPVSTTSTRYIEEVENPILDLDPAAVSTYPDSNVFPGAFSSRETERDRDNYAAKFNVLATSNHWFELTAFGDPSDGVGRDGIATGTFVMEGDSDGDDVLDPAASRIAAGFDADGGRSTIDYGADQQSLRYNGLFPGDWFVQAQVSHRENEFSEISTVNDFRYRDRRAYFEWLFGNGSQGDHELKFGAQYFDLEYTQPSIYSGPTFTLPFPDGMGGTIPVETTSGVLVDVRGGIPDCGNCAVSTGNPYYRVTRGRFSPVPGPVSGEEVAFFLQDTWNISDKFTLKLGVRSTQQELTGSEGFTLNFTQLSSSSFSQDPSVFMPGSYKFDTEWSPRVGFSYDPWGDGKGKAFLHYARYFERVPADLAVRQFSNEVGTSFFEFTDPDLTNPRAGRPIFLQGTSPGRVEDGTKLPYVDEFVLGWEQLIRPDLSFSVRGIFREQGRVLEDVAFTIAEAQLNYYYYYDANDNGMIDDDISEIPFPGFGMEGFGEYVLANPGENTGDGFGTPTREYKAVEFEFQKRMSNNWRMTANYRYSELKGNYEGLFRNDNGQSDPNITSVFDYPDSPIMRGQQNSGPLNSDRPHVLHILGTRVYDSGLELGGGFNWQSGTPRTPLLAHPLYLNSGEIPGIDPVFGVYDTNIMEWTTQSGTGDFLAGYTDSPRGSLGRLPDIATMDLHAGYTVKLARDMRLKLTADVFNLFDSQEATVIDDAVEATTAVPNANFNKARTLQLPRAVRVAANFTW